MAMRPLERFRSIRAKLGSVIVFAVAITLIVSYLAHRVRPAELAEGHVRRSTRSALARSAATGQLSSIPADAIDHHARSPLGTVTVQGANFTVSPPPFERRRSPLGRGRAHHVRELCRRPTAAG